MDMDMDLSTYLSYLSTLPIQPDAEQVQNIIVAATLPSSGLRSIEASLSHKFPTVRNEILYSVYGIFDCMRS